MSNSERDMRTRIFVKILKSCVDGATKSNMLKEATPLTHDQLRRITAELVDKELLRYGGMKPGLYYHRQRASIPGSK